MGVKKTIRNLKAVAGLGTIHRRPLQAPRNLITCYIYVAHFILKAFCKLNDVQTMCTRILLSTNDCSPFSVKPDDSCLAITTVQNSKWKMPKVQEDLGRQNITFGQDKGITCAGKVHISSVTTVNFSNPIR